MDSFKQKVQETKWATWALNAEELKESYKSFKALDEDKDGYITGAQAKKIFVKTNLPNDVLGKIWSLSDVDKDNRLNWKEYALALFLIGAKFKGETLPSAIPETLYDSIFNSGEPGSSTPNSKRLSGGFTNRAVSPPPQNRNDKTNDWKSQSVVVGSKSPPPSSNEPGFYRSVSEVLTDKRKSTPNPKSEEILGDAYGTMPSIGYQPVPPSEPFISGNPIGYDKLPDKVPEPLAEDPYGTPIRTEENPYGSPSAILSQLQQQTQQQPQQSQQSQQSKPNPQQSQVQQKPQQQQQQQQQHQQQGKTPVVVPIENVMDNVHVQHAKNVVLKAIEEDRKGNFESALTLYQKAVEGFAYGMREMKLEQNQIILKNEVDKYTIRIEQLILKVGFKNTSIANQPPSWTEHKTPEGKVYYFNSKTGLSTWQRPPNFPY